MFGQGIRTFHAVPDTLKIPEQMSEVIRVVVQKQPNCCEFLSSVFKRALKMRPIVWLYVRLYPHQNFEDLILFKLLAYRHALNFFSPKAKPSTSPSTVNHISQLLSTGKTLSSIPLVPLSNTLLLFPQLHQTAHAVATIAKFKRRFSIFILSSI